MILHKFLKKKILFSQKLKFKLYKRSKKRNFSADHLIPTRIKWFIELISQLDQLDQSVPLVSLVHHKDLIRFFRGHSDWIRISTTESGLQFEFKNITDDHLNSDSIRNSNQFGFWVNSDFHKFWTNPNWNLYFKSIQICT